MKNFLINLFVNKPASTIISPSVLLKYLLFATLRICSTQEAINHRGHDHQPFYCHNELSFKSFIAIHTFKTQELRLGIQLTRAQIPAIYLFPKCVTLRHYSEALSFSFCICKMGLMLLSLHIFLVFRINNTMDIKPLEEHSAHTAIGQLMIVHTPNTESQPALTECYGTGYFAKYFVCPVLLKTKL